MCAQTTRLSDRQLKAVKPKDKDYVLTDGDGLQLRVRVNRSMQWNFNYRHPVTKNRINMALGSYPEVSLAQARKKTVEARELLAQGIDPKAQRNELQEAKRAETEHTFENVATAWFELKKDSVTPAYAEDIWRSLTLHVFPSMKSTPLSEVNAPMVIKLLRPIEAKGSLETVKRVSQRLNEIMTYGVNSGMIFANPLSGIRAVFKKPKKENMAALPPDELPELMMEIANASIKRTTRCLIEWQLHTMTRPAEAATTRWADIDFDKRIWTIPPERMKKRRPHTIPLTDQALSLLETLKQLSGNREYVFPSDRTPRTHANSQTANMALKRMGFQDRLVSHGLRSMASTILNEHGWDPELIEVALAHVDKDEVRSAYNRADYIERRRPMMAWWSEHIQKAATGSLSASAINQTRDRKVVPIR
ncbi:integrase domain-containing protein [Pseudomonas chlororaphis]|uniref:Phage integrase family protein n=1 Tax=Pseudomonas chlororaphis TaxID=587753 RepID=A0AAX3FZC5_9PSED|nr:integrase domain-containing protein [Pseudomonas chlororaphis]AZC35221.1 Integrase [Pseudomonas chlororaphis subsp. piscium]AZC41762.1 Integrase [Pseudomonas chlororaphis subsp. piscium]WDG73727.1 integrase domain-containing protein [Pseudomonas chlororaphis]WDH28636.1 integrase domain-containing protein [Pseudomonas chlororaphis]WDH72248.1 integrase domain-containing protein [Pseudomonas chlororaphis]